MADFELLRASWDCLGWYGLVIGAIVIGIRQLRKPAVQGILGRVSVYLQWAGWPLWVRLALICASAGGGVALTTLVAGQGWIAAAVAALPVALGAIGTHKVTKAVGHAATLFAAIKGDPVAPPLLQAGRKAAYRPGSLRTTLDSLGVLPLDHKTIKRWERGI